ncbi:trypsin-like peptidase domain-containing protein [Candidatus Woesearchaeota archaeon]|nr:trypsin-like peptidase domain-containing protein [Candidatus Woesearchaeota archaeon]
MEINHFKKRGLSAMLATSLSVTGLGIPCINAQDLESIIKQKEISQEQTKIKNYIKTQMRGFDRKYDKNNNWYNGSLEDLMSQTHKIRSVHTFEVTELIPEGRIFDVSTESIGSAILIDNKDKMTLATCQHVIDAQPPTNIIKSMTFNPYNVRLKNSEFSLEIMEIYMKMQLPGLADIEEIVSFKAPLKLLGEHKASDVAIIEELPGFRAFTSKFHPNMYWGNTSELEPGDYVMAVGHPYNFAKMITQGIVASTGNPFIPTDDHFFNVDMTTNIGQSGGPVYALRDGQPELIGITSFTTMDRGIGGIIKVEEIKKLLDQIDKSEYYKNK